MCLHKSVDVTLGHARYEHIVWHHPHDMPNSGTDCGVLCASGTRLAPTGVDTETRSTEQSV